MTRLLALAPDWKTHLRVHGPLPVVDDLVARLERSDVRGRGGGGFPAHRKLLAAAEHGSGTVVVNWSEGEPAVAKDAALLAHAPHLVIDGALLVARTVRARRAVVAVHEGNAARRVRDVLRQRPDTRHVEVLEVPHRYVAGEAGALVRQLEGGPALPRQRRSPLATGRRPHLVSNAETLACVALVARGGDAGTTLVTVRGAVRRPGVHEVELGTTVRATLDRCGGTTGPLSAVLVGGYAGRWLPTAALDTALDGLQAVGGTLGAGLVVALGVEHCGLAATAAAADYLAEQSAGQCGPCRFGLPAVAADLLQVVEGRADPGARERLQRRAAAVVGRGACSHPDGAGALVTSALEVFADDVERHVDGPGCGRPAGDALAVPS